LTELSFVFQLRDRVWFDSVKVVDRPTRTLERTELIRDERAARIQLISDTSGCKMAAAIYSCVHCYPGGAK